MMNPSNFVSKGELLRWLNDFFEVNYTKVEEACTGAIHCQILDAIFPGKVPLGRVNFNATQEYQYVNNYKVLQAVFNKQQITKHVEVQRLIKGRYQDNLEFLQWMKHFFETRYNGQEYNAIERREGAIKKFSTQHRHTGKKQNVVNRKSNAPRTTQARASAPREKKSTARRGSQQSDMSAEEIAQLHLTLEGLATERTFYYNKLREVEVMLTTIKEGESPSAEVGALIDNILTILYKEDEEFAAPEDGED